MELINYPIMALSACVIAVTIIRVAQLPPGRIRLWEFNRQAGGFILVGLTSMVYSVHRVLNDMWPFKNAGTVSFHVLMITVGASIELVLHTLRSPTVDERAITRIVRRCLLLMTLLIITWLYGFSSEVVDELITLRHVPMAQLYGVSFHAYMVWMLGSVVVTFTGQTMATWRRRPIKAASYLSVAIGCVLRRRQHHLPLHLDLPMGRRRGLPVGLVRRVLRIHRRGPRPHGHRGADSRRAPILMETADAECRLAQTHRGIRGRS